MISQFVIRKARKEDETAVRHCAEHAYAQYVAAIGKKPAPMVADFSSLITLGRVHVAIDAKDRFCGFIVFYEKGDCFFLENVAVHPDMAGKGIGKQLILFCERMAKHADTTSVRLYTNAKMTANLSLYPHLGYRETERRHEDGFDRVFFEKPV
ncbi:GNAT family N-acetyltransferase [Roseobacter litoralis]|uniref:Acetyltransferase-like protein n=1 Tax=Roseobacter litoralis (strain ATCC 49566 / DSM 6996 / JCM 21268 / NBRC 15278 / OCh 149) TaxID=391595 RepID=F7ZBZ6_ROSLO|nr:GNAT family N-acetyltransferase [Roseobacter litoralis]AEI94382.1 acetyltransferase-like protein [Roseobacter litoralis Och 149]